MPLPPRYLATKLTGRLHTTDGGTLVTISDAISYMSGMGKDREMRPSWQRVCELILNRAPTVEITHQIERALFLDYKLDLRSPTARALSVRDQLR